MCHEVVQLLATRIQDTVTAMYDWRPLGTQVKLNLKKKHYKKISQVCSIVITTNNSHCHNYVRVHDTVTVMYDWILLDVQVKCLLDVQIKKILKNSFSNSAL